MHIKALQRHFCVYGIIIYFWIRNCFMGIIGLLLGSRKEKYKRKLWRRKVFLQLKPVHEFVQVFLKEYLPPSPLSLLQAVYFTAISITCSDVWMLSMLNKTLIISTQPNDGSTGPLSDTTILYNESLFLFSLIAKQQFSSSVTSLYLKVCPMILYLHELSASVKVFFTAKQQPWQQFSATHF